MFKLNTNWKYELKLQLDEFEPLEFKWGEVDCANFCASTLSRISNLDLTGLVYKKYNSFQTYNDYIHSLGYSDLVEAVTDRTEFPISAHVHKATYGDIVTMDSGEAQMLGICVGTRSYFKYKNRFLKVGNYHLNYFWDIKCHRQFQ